MSLACYSPKNGASFSGPSLTDPLEPIRLAILETSRRLKNATFNQDGPTAERLSMRLSELEGLQHLVAHEGLKFKGFKGWGVGGPMLKGHSQYNSYVIQEASKLKEYPLASRIDKHKGIELDFVRTEVNHGDHTHSHWQSFSDLQRLVKKSKIVIGKNEEGCPCCLAGLDFDEFAVALKEVGSSIGPETSHSAIADFSSPAHWGAFLGLSGPFSLIGLTAAIRNIRGAGSNSQKIHKVCQALAKDIEATKAQGNFPAAEKMEAFYRTLKYSYFDSNFNFWVPGVINGIASSLVLSTLAIELPLALPAIALYAGCQSVRNAYDFKRNILSPLKISPIDSKKMEIGKRKVNQVMKSKLQFNFANTLGFATFTTGALLTFLSLPMIGLGLSPFVFPLGLALLAVGAASTGYMNNVWPAKFKPRNSSLGINRVYLNFERCLEEISERRSRKVALKPLRSHMTAKGRWYRRYLVFKSAMPESRDFLPESFSRRLRRIRWLPTTGSSVNQLLHDYDEKRVQRQHGSRDLSLYSRQLRLDCLERAVGQAKGPYRGSDSKEHALDTWRLMGKMGIQEQFAEEWLNRNVRCDQSSLDCGSCGGGHAQSHKHHHSHDHHSHDHHSHGPGSHHHHHDHHSHDHDAHHRQSHSLRHGAAERSPDWRSFNFGKMVRRMDDRELNELHRSIDYFLSVTYFV